MYYHLLVETIEKTGKSKDNRIITEVDIINIDEIIYEIAVPYQKGVEFYVNGFVLTKKDIVRFKISESDIKMEQLIEIECTNLLPYITIDSQYILESDIVKDITKKILAYAKEIVISEPPRELNKSNKKEVFIVHGHDNEAKISVARFVETLRCKAIILHEQVNNGMTIIEKIEQNTNVGFAIVLYTPCDKGYKSNETDKAKYRARQNVVFEHGYLISKIGRENVCALVKGDIETPGDMSGVLYIPMDENDGWKLRLAKDMKNSGLDIDLNLI